MRDIPASHSKPRPSWKLVKAPGFFVLPRKAPDSLPFGACGTPCCLRRALCGRGRRDVFLLCRCVAHECSWYTQLSGKDSHFVSKDSKDSWCNLKELFKDVTWCPRNFLHRFRIELPGSLVGSNTCDQRTLKRHDQLRSFNAAVYDLRITSTSYRAFSHFPIW